MKSSLQAKRCAFQSGFALHTATKELKKNILKTKQDYETKLENKMAANNVGFAWSSTKTIAVPQKT